MFTHNTPSFTPNSIHTQYQCFTPHAMSFTPDTHPFTPTTIHTQCQWRSNAYWSRKKEVCTSCQPGHGCAHATSDCARCPTRIEEYGVHAYGRFSCCPRRYWLAQTCAFSGLVPLVSAAKQTCDCKVYFCTMGKHTSTRLSVADIDPGSLASSLPHFHQLWS